MLYLVFNLPPSHAEYSTHVERIPLIVREIARLYHDTYITKAQRFPVLFYQRTCPSFM